MRNNEETLAAIEQYLKRLRKSLSHLQEADTADILQELRSHILERLESERESSGGGIGAILASLGTPEEMASEYVTENILAAAASSRSPLMIMKGIFRLASVSLAGFAVLIGSLMGYLVGLPLLLMALAKPFIPNHVGLWIQTGAMPHSLFFGISIDAMQGQDLLGWWIVPLGLIVGLGTILLVLKFDLWCIRRYQRQLADLKLTAIAI